MLLASLGWGCGSGDSSSSDNGVADLGGDLGPMLENPGFPVPTAATAANVNTEGVWSEVGPADWSCLETPNADQPSTQAIALSGSITDFQDGTGIGNATVTAFPGILVGGNSGTATSSDVAVTRGNFALNLTMLPAGETRFGFALEATGYVKTYVLDQYLDPADTTQARDWSPISVTTATSMLALVSQTRDVGEAVVLGTFRDCAGREVSNAVATVSSTSGTATHLTDAETFYFSATTGTPVNHVASPTMNRDGRFMVLNLAPQTPAFIQVWGFTSAAALSAGTLELLAEQPVPIEANTIVTGSIEPLRAP